MGQIEDLIQYDEKNPSGAGTSPEEKLFLYGLVRQIQPKKVIEIGSKCGHSAAWLALAIKHNGGGALACVDNFKGTAGGGGGSSDKVYARLRANRVAKFVTIFEMDSQTFLKTHKANSVDMVYVDGAHTEEEAKADIKEALRVASKLVVVHDALNLEGVTEACKASKGGTWLPGYRGMWIKSKAAVCRTKRIKK